MENSSGLSAPLIVGLCLLFPIVFSGLWCLVLSILSRVGGWHSLARVYRAAQFPQGSGFRRQSGAIGWVNYNNCLSIHATTEGFYLSVFPLLSFAHPPLWIPWSAVHGIMSRKILWRDAVCFNVGSPKIASLTLPKQAFASLPALIEKTTP
jgi:hypothetical protein